MTDGRELGSGGHETPNLKRRVSIGGLTHGALLAALGEAGVQLNASADILMSSAIFDVQERTSFAVVGRTVAELGLPAGGSLSTIYAQAQAAGLLLCPAITGPYLRLVTIDQQSAPDSVLSNGNAPSGSVTVASAPPAISDDEFPKGFYLRVVDGVVWLRGYRASEQHVWSPQDCFAFREPEPA